MKLKSWVYNHTQFQPEYSSEEELQNDEPVEQRENNEKRLEKSARKGHHHEHL